MKRAVTPDSPPVEKKKSKLPKIGKGVETLYRTTIPALVTQTQFADNKASIMMSINGVIISVLVAFRDQITAGGPQLTVPGAVMAIASLGSAICSILAAMPNLSTPTVTEENMRSPEINHLFFGVITQIDRLTYATLIRDVCEDPERIYWMLSLQIHGLGQGLSRKFRLLRYSYILFLTGLILSAIVFFLAEAIPFSP